MKFGRNLLRNQVPEWTGSYIDYKGLKKQVKELAEKSKNGEQVDPTGLLPELDRNLENVDSFYNKMFIEAKRRFVLLRDGYGKLPDGLAGLDRDEIEELADTLVELRGRFRDLQRFGEINRRGFVKITQKLDKKVLDSTMQQRYIPAMVDRKPFATDAETAPLLTEIGVWLAALENARAIDDSEPGSTIRSLKRIVAKARLNTPPALLERVDQVVRDDDVDSLKTCLAEGGLIGPEPSRQGILLCLLQGSIVSRSRQSVDYLLENITSLDEPDAINGRNCIHRLVIHIGRTKTASPPPPAPIPSHLPASETPLLPKSDEAVQMLLYVLEKLEPNHRQALVARDAAGRLPLHYAAQYGFVVVIQEVMKAMQKWDQFEVENGIDAPEWRDHEGYTPLHLAVLGGHALTTRVLLQAEKWQGGSSNSRDAHWRRRTVSGTGVLLALATRSNQARIVRFLIDAGTSINWQDETGEAALHIAARFGCSECAEVLLHGTGEQRADLNLAEKSSAWTPLHVAAVDGHFSVARLLVDAGADVGKLDSSGWTAKEHAALRGHLKIANFLEAKEASNTSSGGQKTTVVPSFEDRKPQGSSQPAYRYLQDRKKNESGVLVSLGSLDMRKKIEAVELDRTAFAGAHTTQLDTTLSVVVSAIAAEGEPATFDLPIQENIATEPITFTAADATKVKLVFDIVPTHSSSKKSKIGRAVVLLSSLNQDIGGGRWNLQGDFHVPILGSDLGVIGAVNFNFWVILPFSHPNMDAVSRHTHWKIMKPTPVIGHRGLGKNTTAKKSLQIGENTIPSFVAAANLGAEFVEFDVQLTKDHVPVIYHDFLVSETGLDAPMHALTLEQFLRINPENPPSHHHAPTTGTPGTTRKRAMSTGSRVDYQLAKSLMDERMKYTRDFANNGFKANTVGNFVQAPFATLEGLFRRLPGSLGFNIEMKYPMLYEAEDHEMGTYAVELNAFCNTVLAKVHDLAITDDACRRVVFSSFSPDVCVCMRLKQSGFPVLFLTDASDAPISDVRASSLQEAVRFAKRWDLAGIVSHAEPFVNSPRLVGTVRQNGLLCFSYGAQNNDPALVQRQVKGGLDAVIVDEVLAIHRSLRDD